MMAENVYFPRRRRRASTGARSTWNPVVHGPQLSRRPDQTEEPHPEITSEDHLRPRTATSRMSAGAWSYQLGVELDDRLRIEGLA